MTRVCLQVNLSGPRQVDARHINNNLITLFSHVRKHLILVLLKSH
jgi:hypothetical protein